jgi:squalene synthase HpnC
MSTSSVQQAYRWCRTLAQSHYENFPVASRLLPAALRDPVAAIYAFARTADDIADEGDTPPPQRLAQLDEMGSALHAIAAGEAPDSPLYLALADSIDRYQLPPVLLHDLLSAFRQDVVKNRYADFGEVMDYCRRSANPVGRLLLQLSGHASERNLAMSDAVCSALQLINFLQDIEQDYRENDRIYIPQDELRQFGVSEEDIRDLNNNPRVSGLLQYQTDRCDRLLSSGSALGRQLPGRFGLELRAIILGASRVLDKLRQQDNVFSRPRLHRMDRIRIAWGALVSRFARL